MKRQLEAIGLAVVLVAAGCGRPGQLDDLGPAPTQDLSADGGLPSADSGLPLQKFAVIGDYGSASANEAAVAQLVKGSNPDFVLTLGDNNYPSGELATIDANIGQYYSEYIAGYRGIYGPGSPVMRFWPAVGNHDRYSNPPLAPYLDYFHALPGNQRYYDIAVGRVHLFVIESALVGEPGSNPDGCTADSVQAAWLRDRLAASTACFKIVYFHHPPISSGSFAVATMRWPFHAWGADVVLAGHEHFYERLDLDGIPLLINGLGGEDKFGFMSTPAPESQVRFNSDFGALFATAGDALHFEFVTVEGITIDTLTLPKHCP